MPTSAPEPLLEISGLSAGYGKIGVLQGIDLRVGKGEIVALLGPNGAGKSTLLKAVSGLLPRSGSIRFAGKDMSKAGPRDAVNEGLVHVVEGHRVFTQLTVFDNLLLAGYGMPRGELAARVEEALAFFPEIAAKRVDEPSAGLSPVLVDRVLGAVARLRTAGTAVLLVEQLIEKALAASDRVYALARGSIVLEARTDEADLPNRLEHAYFGQDVSAPLSA